MKISPHTKISELIKQDPRSIDAIASINPHFEKLRNPLLRKILASRVTIKDASRIGGCAVNVFLDKLREIGFETENAQEILEDANESRTIKVQEENLKVLDVRPDLSAGKDPFLKIMQVLREIKEQETLLLINSFEPVPLIKILNEKGYTCVCSAEEGVVNTYIKKAIGAKDLEFTKPNDEPAAKPSKHSDKVFTIDVRALEMPGPMLAILKALDTLPADHALHVHHKKVPQFLIPELEQRGFDIQIDEVCKGNVELMIRRHAES